MRLNLIAILLLCVASFTGCVSAGKNFDASKLSEIEKGKTTEADLVRMFGAPIARGQTMAGGKTITWMYVEARAQGKSFIPIAGPFIAGADSKSKSLTVSLATDGTVSDYNYADSGVSANAGTQRDPQRK